MYSTDSKWRRFIGFIEKNPLVDSVLEMIVILTTTFTPFAIAAAWPLLYETPVSSDKFLSSFFGFFSRGELSISLLGLCGTILWLFFIRAAVTSKLGKFMMALVMALLLIVGLGIIAGNPSFSKNPPIQTHVLLIFAYIGALIIWFITLLVVKLPQDPGVSDDADGQRSKDLLARAGRAQP